ncbi:hypothetical protein UW163_01510 [Ralstonia solanacearum]|nr:hypothetical protein UW163_01510 [Ralstonia solanacearum]
MQHRVAVGTYGTKVLARINLILLADAGYVGEMVYVNESSSHLSIGLVEVEATHVANRLPVLDARGPGLWVSFVLVYDNLLRRAFNEGLLIRIDFIGVDDEGFRRLDLAA